MFTGLLIIGAILAIMFLIGGMQFNTAYVPGPIDELTRLEALTNRNADFNGTQFDMGTGFAPNGPGIPGSVVIRTTVRAAGTYNFIVEERVDETAGWTTVTHAVPVDAVGTIGIPCFISNRFIRVRLDLTGVGAAITYEAFFVAHQP